MNDDGGPVSLLRGPLPTGVDVRLIVIDVGDARPFDPDEWQGAFVVVERGEVEAGGSRFVAGDMVSFDGLTSLRELRNPGEEPTLIAVARRNA